ncbi:MAG: hypothetical protein LBK97_01320 [Prevotellaceae bacterium]|jgi:hypothetical protein|nr:hypothetical protein [Prevotellaceae bacterium]
MKRNIRLLGLIALLGGVMFMTSCSKEKTCECTVSVTIMGQTQTQTVSGKIDDGDCNDAANVPGLQEAKNALSGYGSLNVSCREK